MIKNNKNAMLKGNIEQFLDLNEIEKTSLIMDQETDKTMKILAESYVHIESPEKWSSDQKRNILDLWTKDNSFIDKCKKYKIAFNYTKNIYEDSDIKELISRSIINGEIDNLEFYNLLLSYGQKEIFDEYDFTLINKNNKLKKILDQCGYKKDSKNSYIEVGKRFYRCDENIKKYYYIIRH